MQKNSLGKAGPQRVSFETWRLAESARQFLLADRKGFDNIRRCADVDPGTSAGGRQVGDQRV